MIGWVYELKEIKGKVTTSSIVVYTIGFWSLAIILPAVSVNAYTSKTWTTIVVQYGLLPVLVYVSSLFSRQNSFSEWFNIVFYSGVRKISKYITLISNPEKQDYNQTEWWESVFKFWWCASIKYVIPFGVIHGIMYQFRLDTKDKYQGYPLSIQFFGWSILIVAMLIVVTPIFLITKGDGNPDAKEKPFDVMAMEHFTEQVIIKKKQERQEIRKEAQLADMDAGKDTDKVGISSRSIVQTESNLRLDGDEED